MKTKGIYLLYRFLQALALPVVLAYFFVRSARNLAYFPSIWQRLGFLSRSFIQTVPGAIWLHAVSVGEVLSVIELVRRLRSEFPRAPIFVSTATLAGRATAREKLSGLATGVFYAPLDHVFAVRRVLRTLQPALVIVVETEIWPNLFREAKRAGCGLIVVNGRISDRTWRRYRLLRWFFRHAMSWPDAVLAQSATMRERYLSVGTPAQRVRVGGNLKYDFVPRESDSQSPVRRFIEGLRPAEVWIAASTDVDEENPVIEVFQHLARQHTRLLLVIAPRKPERFDAVAAKLERTAARFVRRSDLRVPLELPAVLLLDSMGELSGLFPLANIVFMGGTLALRGGHNILEPAFFARPVICGPHMENFREIAEQFRAAGAFVEIEAAAQLAGAVDGLLKDRSRAADVGRRALECAEANRGATEKAIAAVREITADACPRFRPNFAEFWFYWPLSWLWRLGGAWKRRRDLRRRRKLDAAVVSVGNLTMGGTGKTPLVLYLAEEMRRAGHRPGILTRGHGRHSLEKHLILEPGAHVPVSQSGDEAQMFLRAGVAALGIGSDRFVTGRMLEERFGADVLILDDGFQHVRLARQADIVLIDAIRPFGGGEVFPLGWLREPLEALARAEIIVITRSECVRGTFDLKCAIRRYNGQAPIFYARAVPEYWVEAGSGRQVPELTVSRVGAFCGLGNPESFWCSLEEIGLETVQRVSFDDHHTYRAREVHRMAQQFVAAKAEAAITTEKDVINLGEGNAGLFAPLPLYWLKIRTAIDREAEFLELIERRLGARRRDSQAGHG
ncbi:MAG TPA: tetraacyldisaccharide 4'-kinase [Bryobacteraceae bacterium]|nr:tetraacyldisaccharide 4'-kinase [Bryobacteraceae bacterium]